MEYEYWEEFLIERQYPDILQKMLREDLGYNRIPDADYSVPNFLRQALVYQLRNKAPWLDPLKPPVKKLLRSLRHRGENNEPFEKDKMEKYVGKLRDNLQASIQSKQEFLANEKQQEMFGRAVDLVVKAYRAGGRLYIAGNGGSAADAQHLATEFVSKLARPRAALPAEALPSIRRR